jgi:hypothetical protein
MPQERSGSRVFGEVREPSESAQGVECASLMALVLPLGVKVLGLVFRHATDAGRCKPRNLVAVPQ